MRLYSKNLLMSKPASEYEILDSLKINYQCFFILDEFQISAEDIEVEMVAHIDKNTTGNNPELFRSGAYGDKTSLRTHARHSMNQYRFFIGDKYVESPNNTVSTYLKRKVVTKRNKNGTTTTSVLDTDGTVVWTKTTASELLDSSSHFYIHGNSESNATFSGHFYSFKITQNGETIYDIVPAQRNSDGVLGLLNMVDNKFYENQGSGIIERGEEIA